MVKADPFNNNIKQYEQWFDNNEFVYKSELSAIDKLLPKQGRGIEIGIGTGLFAQPLGIIEGCDPSEKMRNLAIDKGLKAINGVAENLPYTTESVDFVLMVTTICFVNDVNKAFEEIKRVLKPNGTVIIAFVDKNSPVGKSYLKHKEKSVFYKDAVFYSTKKVFEILNNHKFEVKKTMQTVFGNMKDINKIQMAEDGHGKGSFIVIKAIKQ